MSRNIIFYLILLTLPFSVLSYDPQNWTYLVFAEQWPPAACLEVPHGECLIPKGVIGWTIHGLWPTDDTGYPSFCNNSWPFRPETLKPILSALEVKWPNIYADSTENSFWKHEWLKHGTCAASEKKLRGELNYFKKSLKLHDNYNIAEMLRKANILPDGDKPQLLKYIENAITLQLKTSVKIFCKNHKNYTDPILESLYICTDRSLNLIDCDEVQDPPCKSPYVMYLPFADKLPVTETAKVTFENDSDVDEFFYTVNVI